MSISPDPGGKRRFSSTNINNINIVCLCHGTTNANVQLVNDLNMIGLLTIDCDSGQIFIKVMKWFMVPNFTKQCRECV